MNTIDLKIQVAYQFYCIDSPLVSLTMTKTFMKPERLKPTKSGLAYLFVLMYIHRIDQITASQTERRGREADKGKRTTKVRLVQDTIL